MIAMFLTAFGCAVPASDPADNTSAISTETDTSTDSSANTSSTDTSNDLSTDSEEPESMDILSQENSLPEESDGSEGFVLVTDVIPEVILEIRYFSTYNFVGERIDGYEQPCALLTKEAAEALKAVSDDVMAQGYRLKIFDAYRPQTAVEHFVRWAADPNAEEMKPYFYPDMEKSRLFAEGYIASKSGHSRGSTVDLTLFDVKTGKEVDMGGVFDYLGRLSHFNYTSGLTEEQIANRKLLRDVMVKHGFRPISTEWWHFTLIEEPYPDTYFSFPVSADSVK